MVIYAIIIFLILAVFGYMFGWVERKLIAKAQYRHGPTYVGKYGILQNFADLVKLFSKASLDLDNADSILYSTSNSIISPLYLYSRSAGFFSRSLLSYTSILPLIFS